MGDEKNDRGWIKFLWLGGILGVFAIILTFLVRRRNLLRTRQQERVWQSVATLVPMEIQGLSEDEAAARRQEGQVNTIELEPTRSKREIIRENTLSIFILIYLTAGKVDGV